MEKAHVYMLYPLLKIYTQFISIDTCLHSFLGGWENRNLQNLCTKLKQTSPLWLASINSDGSSTLTDILEKLLYFVSPKEIYTLSAATPKSIYSSSELAEK